MHTHTLIPYYCLYAQKYHDCKVSSTSLIHTESRSNNYLGSTSHALTTSTHTHWYTRDWICIVFQCCLVPVHVYQMLHQCVTIQQPVAIIILLYFKHCNSKISYMYNVILLINDPQCIMLYALRMHKCFQEIQVY